MTVGEEGGQEFWDTTDATDWYQIDCDPDYAKGNARFGWSLTYIGDVDGDADSDDEFVVGCPGWDTTDVYNSDPEDDRGGVYMIAH
jgi:hypothetical protein